MNYSITLQISNIKYQKEVTAPKESKLTIIEEEWTKHEETWGIPRTAIQHTVGRMARAVEDMKGYIDQKFAKYERMERLDELAQNPEFSDVKKYTKEIDQYLEKVDPRYRAHPDAIRDAAIYAYGLNRKKYAQNAQNHREINKRISGVARPASPGAAGKSGGQKPTPSLTAIQKSAARSVGMSEAEYAKLLTRGRVIAE